MSKKAVIATLAAMFAAPVLAADNYTLDSRHTYPMYEIDHWGWSLQRGRFNETSGKITLDRAAKTGTVDVTVKIGSIDTGLAKWNEVMKSDEFFDAAKYPVMTFKASKIEFNGDKPASVPGELTIKGITKPVTLEIARFGCGPNPVNKKEICGADASAHIKRSEFNIMKYLPGIGDDVKLVLNVEAVKD